VNFKKMYVSEMQGILDVKHGPSMTSTPEAIFTAAVIWNGGPVFAANTASEDLSSL
jgi:hypothetical protein